MRYINSREADVSENTGKSRLLRRLAIAGGVVAALIVILALLLPVLVDVNQYRGLIQSEAEKALGRPVTLGEMSLTLFPAFGIKVQNPEVKGLLTARSLTVGARLWPLVFGGTIELNRVVLEHPEITVTKKADGSWDVQELGAGGSAEAAQERPARGFTLSRLRVADGLVHLRSAAARGGAPAEVDLQLDLTASLDMPAGGDLSSSFDGSLKSEGLELALSGELRRQAGTTRFDVTLSKSDIAVERARELARVAGFAWPVPEGLLRSRSLQASGHAEGALGDKGLVRIALSGVTLSGADVQLTRDRRGVWNVAALTGGGSSAAGEPASAGPDVTIKDLSLEGAHLTIRDESSGAGGSPVELELSDLGLKVDSYEPGKPVTLHLRSGVTPGKGSIRVDGTLPTAFDRDASSPIDASLELSSIEVASVAGYLKSLLDVAAESGRVSAQATIGGTYPARVTGKGTLSLDAVKVAAAPKPVTAKASFDLAAADAARRIDIADLTVEFGDSRLAVRGKLDNQPQSTIADLEIPPASVNAADLTSLLAVAGVELPVTFSATSPVKLQANVRGDLRNPSALDLTGSVEVAGGTLQHPSMTRPLEQLAGKVTLRKDGFDVTGFTGVVGGSDVGGRMTVNGFDASDVTFALTSRHADFWELMSFIRSDEGATGAPSPGPSAPGGDPLARIAAKGTLAIADGSFGALAFKDLDCGLALQKKVIRLDPVSMSLYAGTMKGSASMDLNPDPAEYTVTATTAGIDTNALLTSVLDMKDMLAGSLSADVTVRASGASLDGVLAAAKGSGSVKIENGRVGAINILKVLSRASDVLGEQSLKEVSGRLAKDGTDFSLMTADLKVGSGKITSGNLTLSSPDLDLRDDGTLDMLKGTIDIAGEVVFSDAVSRAMLQEKSKAADYFWDSKRERVALPLTMAGPLDAPTPNIDWKTAGGRLAQRRVEETVAGRLEKAGLGGLLGSKSEAAPKAAPPSTTAPPPSAPAAPAGPGGLDAAIEETELAGNILMRDLKIKGTVSGTGIAAADLVVKDESGRKIHQESLMKKVEKYYQSHDRSAPATITFRATVDGKQLLAAKGDVEVTVTVRDAEGHETTRTSKVRK